MSWKIRSNDKEGYNKLYCKNCKTIKFESYTNRKGLVRKEHYSVPKSFAERYEDDHVFLSLTENDLKEKYKK